ncbi:MAG: hypothetical protein LBP65_01525 [Puniceicoccales bacterium]|nr:hypothetical protein [Puniceicoccales bacterium]
MTFYTGLIERLIACSASLNANANNSNLPSTEASSNPAATSAEEQNTLNGQQAAEGQSIVSWIPAGQNHNVDTELDNSKEDDFEEDDFEEVNFEEEPASGDQQNGAETSQPLSPPPPLLSEVDENLMRWKALNHSLGDFVRIYYVKMTPAEVDKDLYKKYMIESMVKLSQDIELSPYTLPDVHRTNIENFLKKCMEAFKLMESGLKKLGAKPDPNSKEIKLVNDLQAVIATLSEHLTTCEDAAATGLCRCGAQLKILLLRIQGSDTPMKARIAALCECIIPDAVGHAIARILPKKKGTTAPAEILELESLIGNVLANLQLPWKTELSPMRYCGCAIGAANLLTLRCPSLLESQRGGEFTGKDGVGVTFEMHLMQILTALGATNIAEDAMCAIRAIIRLVLQEITSTKLPALLTSFSGIEEILCEDGNDAWENLKFSNDLLHTLVGVLVAYPASETGKTYPLPAGTAADSLIKQFQGQSLRQVRDTLEKQDSSNPIMYALSSPEAVRIFNQYCVQITLNTAPEFKEIIENIPVPFEWQDTILKPEVVAPAATTHPFGNHFHDTLTIPHFNDLTTGTVEVVVDILSSSPPPQWLNWQTIQQQRLLNKKQDFLALRDTAERLTWLEEESKCSYISISLLILADTDVIESFSDDFRELRTLIKYCVAGLGNVLADDKKLVQATRDLVEAFQAVTQFRLRIHSNRDICPRIHMPVERTAETNEDLARARNQIILRNSYNREFCTLCLEFYKHLVRNEKTNVANALFRTPNVSAASYFLEWDTFPKDPFRGKIMNESLFGRCIQIIPNVFWKKVVNSLQDDEFLSFLGDSVASDCFSPLKTPYLAFLLFHIASAERFPAEYHRQLCNPFGKSSFQMVGKPPARDKLAGAQAEEQLFERLERLVNGNNDAVAQLLKKLLFVHPVTGESENEAYPMGCNTCWIQHEIIAGNIFGNRDKNTLLPKFFRKIHFSITPYAYEHLLPLMINCNLLRSDGNGNYIDGTNRVWRFVAIPAMVSLSTGQYIHIDAGPAIMGKKNATQCRIERRIALCHTEHGSLPIDEPVTFLDANGKKISLSPPAHGAHG